MITIKSVEGMAKKAGVSMSDMWTRVAFSYEEINMNDEAEMAHQQAQNHAVFGK